MYISLHVTNTDATDNNAVENNNLKANIMNTVGERNK